MNRHFPDEEAATATGLGTMSIFLGITVGLIVTPPLVTAVGVRGSQFVYAGVAAGRAGGLLAPGAEARCPTGWRPPSS